MLLGYLKRVSKVSILGIIIILLIKTYSILDYNYQVKIIQKDNYSTLDYIKIPKVNIERIVKKGINDDCLNKNFACVEYIDSNIIIAGHAIEQVFLNLYNIKNNDEIEVKINSEYNIYKVNNIYKLTYTEYMNYNIKNSLILITCLNDFNKRLIVVAKK